jgi:hypothetical protein
MNYCSPNATDFTSLSQGAVVSYNDTIIYFDSESELNSYMTDRDYEKEGYGFGKVAFAYVINTANVAQAQWDYSIRVNYTTVLETDAPTVACLYGSPCNFDYSIPTTNFYTDDLSKPQLSDYLFGYAYTGFSTLQTVIDSYILGQYAPPNQLSGPRGTEIIASLGLMPTKSFVNDDFQVVISSTLGIFYILSFLYPVSRLIRALVLEKEHRIKEG